MILIILINFKQFLNEDLTWNLQVDQRYFPITTQKVIENQYRIIWAITAAFIVNFFCLKVVCAFGFYFPKNYHLSDYVLLFISLML